MAGPQRGSPDAAWPPRRRPRRRPHSLLSPEHRLFRRRQPRHVGAHARRAGREIRPARAAAGRGGDGGGVLLLSSSSDDWPGTVTAIALFHYCPPRWQARNEVGPMLHGRRVAVLGGVRIPFCRQNTAYSDVGNLGMSVRTLGALVEKFGLHGQQLGEVAMGAVIKHPSDWNLGREATLSSGLSPLTPGITLQRACGTSLDALITIGNKIATGQIEAGIGGGSDTTSDVPIVYGQKLRRRLLEAARGKSTRDRLAAFKGFHFRELKPEFPGVAEPRTGKSMGDHCEDMAKEWNIDRKSTRLNSSH